MKAMDRTRERRRRLRQGGGPSSWNGGSGAEPRCHEQTRQGLRSCRLPGVERRGRSRNGGADLRTKPAGDDGKRGSSFASPGSALRASWEQAHAIPAVVRQPWVGARGGRKRPESRGARRGRAKRRRLPGRPEQGMQTGPRGRDRWGRTGPRSARAEAPGHGHRRGRCRGDGERAHPPVRLRLHRCPRLPTRWHARACRGPRASHRSWPRRTQATRA